MDWIAACRVLLNRPKVIHRLPGRLRVHVPFLQRLDKEQQRLADRVASLLSVAEEIQSVSVNLVTGTALICFDPASVTEREVLDYMRDMFEIFVRNRDTIEELVHEQNGRAFQSLELAIGDAVGQRLRIDPKLALERYGLE